MTLLRAAVACVALIIALRPARAQQCPDGSAAPCRGRGARSATLDPQLIAILPFRVSGADPSLVYLRDGLAELLAVELTGDTGPRAVEAGEALRAWSRARAGAEPAAQSAATRVARQLGAGQVGIGGVVGTSRHITVTLAIFNIAGGTTPGMSVKAEGSPDSLSLIVLELSQKVLARRAGTSRVCVTDPAKTNPEALRAFLAGRAAYRSGELQESVRHFRRVLDLDASCVSAAYWLAILREVTGVPGPPDGDRSDSLAWVNRTQLSRDQRSLLEAMFGPGGPRDRHGRRSMHAALQRAAGVLAGPEVWHLLGGSFLTYGALIGYVDAPARARAAFERAFAIDSGLEVAQHAALLAFRQGDKAGHTRWLARLVKHDSTDGQTLWHQYLNARLAGNAAAARTALDRFARAGLPGGFAFTRIFIPSRELEEAVRRIEALAPAGSGLRGQMLPTLMHIATNGGQPGRAEALRDANFPNPVFRDRMVLLNAEDDSASAERLALALRGDVGGPQRWNLQCEVLQSRLRRADTTDLSATLAALRSATPREALVCADVAEAIAISMGPGAGIASLVAADSLLLNKAWLGVTQEMNPQWNYDLAVAFARRGEWRAAAAAVRRRITIRAERLAVSLRDEGRWSLLAGDTASAVNAFRHFLQLRDNPEPVKAGEAEAIRAQLVALEVALRRGRGGRGGRGDRGDPEVRGGA